MNPTSGDNARATEARNSEPFLWPVRVYYEDTDAAGVVYYANYLKYMERARTEWLRQIGFEQTDLVQRYGVVFVVRSVNIEYLLPARFDDELQVAVELINVGAGQIDLIQRVVRADALLVRATVKLACVARATMRATRIPQPLATRIRMES